MSRFAIPPPKGSPLGFASWAREMRALAACTMAPPVAVAHLPRGDGHTVLVLPGFLTGDWSTARLRGSLGALGYRAVSPGVSANLGPTPALNARLDRALLDAAAAGPVSLVGQSLGGVLARELAKRHPHAVRRVVTLCSPVRMPVVTNLHAFVAALEPFFDRELDAGAEAVAAPPPQPLTAIYSPQDGIVDWRACVPDPAGHVEAVAIDGPHTTMGSYGPALALLADRLARPV